MKNLNNRLAKIEQALWSKEASMVRKPDVTIDQVLEKLGLNPVLIRQEAQDHNCSLAEVVYPHLGVGMNEFKRLLKERVSRTP